MNDKKRERIEKIILKIVSFKINLRVILSWGCFFPTIMMVLYIVSLQNIISNKILKDIIFCIIIILNSLNIFYSIYFVPFILCTPKLCYSDLPKKIHNRNYKGKISAVEIKKGVYKIILEHQKEFILDMSGWIFKKTYIRDILLMYYHLDFYNKNRFKSKKCLSKNFFPDDNIKMVFESRNGKKKYLWLIKNGKEKRSIICSYKIFMLCTGALEAKSKYSPEDEHRQKTIETFYF